MCVCVCVCVCVCARARAAYYELNNGHYDVLLSVEEDEERLDIFTSYFCRQLLQDVFPLDSSTACSILLLLA
jgi:hypothetical protein